MSILIAGATGATGKLLASELLNRGQQITVIVRSPDRLPDPVRQHKNCRIIQGSVLDLSAGELTLHLKECVAVVSCLGHTLSWKGVYGQPRRLVTESARRLCEAVMTNKPVKPVKFILMNTAGNSNRDINEPVSTGERLVIGLIRLLLPPHVDNEKAADFLRTGIGQDHSMIEWVAVRPDSLIDEEMVTRYDVFPSPIRSALFNAGKTSRINVGHFMAELIMDDKLWAEWKGKMPVIYNREREEELKMKN
jgi:NAD(P)-dependent dehydrogenase (short-subunit alcohol dehydrogenase family)